MGLIVLQYANMLFEAKGMTGNSVIHPNSCSHETMALLYGSIWADDMKMNHGIINGDLFRDAFGLFNHQNKIYFCKFLWYFIPVQTQKLSFMCRFFCQLSVTNTESCVKSL